MTSPAFRKLALIAGTSLLLQLAGCAGVAVLLLGVDFGVRGLLAILLGEPVD